MNSRSLKAARIPAFFVSINAAIALILGIFSLLTGIYLWMRFHLHFPAKDTLHVMPFVQTVLENGFLSPSLADWLAPHARAHRIAVTRLAMVIDHQYFGGQNHVIYALTWLGVAALLLVFVTTFRRNYKSESVLCVFVIGISLIFLSSSTQAWNLVNPINSSWYLALSASAVSILLLTHKVGPPSAVHVVMAYLLAVVGAYSNFAGVIVWLLLPVLVGFRSVRTGLLTAVISGVFIALYLHGMDTGLGGSQPVPNVVEPGMIETERSVAGKLLVFVAALMISGVMIIASTCSYLGAPLSSTHPIWASLLVILSFIVLIAAWRELLKYWFRGIGQHSSWLETTLAIGTVTLGIAITTQVGRTVYAAPTADRYQTVVMLYWLCICCLVLYFGLKAERAQMMRKFVSTTLSLGIAAALLLVDSRSMANAVRLAETANRVSSLGVLGVSGAINYGDLLPIRPPDFLPGLNAYFMKNKAAYWHDVSRQISFDQSVACDPVHAGIKPSRWPGISVVTVHIREQWPKLYRQIPVTTAQGEVIGFLSPVMVGKVTPLSIYSGDEDTWTGYIRRSESRDEEVYLHYRTSLHSGVSCRLQM